MSFDDFMEQFRKRHAKDFGIDSRGSVAVKAPMVKADVKKAPAPVPVAQVVDRKSAAAGDDWAEIVDNWNGEAEVVE